MPATTLRAMTADVRTRRVRREEWERVRDIRLRALTESPDAFGSTFERERPLARSEWIDFIEGWSGATNALYVAEAGDAWIGIAVGSRAADEPVAHLYAMWVDPAWRARGVGTRLVNEVRAWARSWAATSVVLNVTGSNEAAVAFYARLGFVATGERHLLREGSHLFVRVMRRTL